MFYLKADLVWIIIQSTMLNSPKSAIPTNSLIKGKYKLVKKIGQGAFGM